MAPLPDFPDGVRLDLDVAHLHHDFRELVLPQPWKDHVDTHQVVGHVIRGERSVGREENLAVQHVLVVLVIQVVGGLVVLHHRVVSAIGRRAARL